MFRLLRTTYLIVIAVTFLFFFFLFLVEKPLGYIGASIFGLGLLPILWGTASRTRWAYLITHQYWRAQSDVINGKAVPLKEKESRKQSVTDYLPKRSLDYKSLDFIDLLKLIEIWGLEFVTSRNYVFIINPRNHIHPHEKIIASADLDRPYQWVLRRGYIQQCHHRGVPEKFLPNSGPLGIHEHLTSMIAGYLQYSPEAKKLNPADLYYIITVHDRALDIPTKISNTSGTLTNLINRHNFKHHKEVFFTDNPEYKDAPEEWVAAVFQ